MAHAKLSPSGAAMWTACPASVKAQEGIPDKGNNASREGTAAHDLAERCIVNNRTAASYIGEEIEVEGYKFTVDKIMATYVQMYVDYVATTKAMADVWHYGETEIKVDFSHIIPKGYGHSDYVCIYEEDDKLILHVKDLKYGMTEVAAEENKQGLLYAIGARHVVGWMLDREFDVIRIAIHQPRVNDDPSEWDVTAAELDEWEEYFQTKAQEAMAEDAPFNPGEAQCKWCRAKNLCRARRDYAMQIALFDFDQELDVWAENSETSMPKPSLMSLEEVAALMPHLDAVAKWCREVKDFAYAEAMAGRPIGGYKLVAGSKSRAWRDEDAVGKYLEKLDGVEKDDVYTTKVISPAQAEKLLGKKKALELLSEQIETSPGNPKLVPDSHKASAIEVNPVADFD